MNSKKFLTLYLLRDCSNPLLKSAVTHLFDKDVSLEEIKDFVGHSSSKITKDVYLQKSNERQEKILDILNETMQELK